MLRFDIKQEKFLKQLSFNSKIKILKRRININKSIPIHIIFKELKANNKQNISKAVREERHYIEGDTDCVCVQILIAINFHHFIVFASSCKFQLVVFVFTFIRKYILISFVISLLTYQLLLRVFFNVHVSVNFPNFLLLFTSNLILLQIEHILCMKYIFNLLKGILPTIWLILQCILQKKCISCYFWVEYSTVFCQIYLVYSFASVFYFLASLLSGFPLGYHK